MACTIESFGPESKSRSPTIVRNGARPLSRWSGTAFHRRSATSTDGSNVQYYDELAHDYALFFQDLDKNMAEEGDWLDRVLRKEGARRILDASCGSGRQAIPLAERGYDVTGADPSASMLQQANREAQSRGVQVRWIESGFVDLPSQLDGQFDAVIALGNGMCNQERLEDIEASLGALCQCVRPGGLCLVGIKDYDAVKAERARFHGHQIKDTPEERAILFEVWDFEDPLLISTAYSLHGHDDSWTVHSAATREYMLEADALRDLARRAGFGRAERVDHPTEMVFALRRGTAGER